MDLVSVIVPVFNVDKYIRECLDSILEQTYKELEILLIDDGSSDLSGKICDDYKNKYKNIRVFHRKNSGVSNSRNFGIEQSNGKYIIFIDSDDKISPTFVEKMVDKSNDCQLVCCNYSFWYKDLLIDNKYDNVGYLNCKDLKLELFKKNSIKGYSCNKLFRTDIIKKNNVKFNPDIKICEDLLFCFTYCQYVKRAYIIKDNLYYYRMRKTSASNYKNDRDLTVFDAFLRMYEIDNNVYEYGKSLYAYVYFKYRKRLNKNNNVKKIGLFRTLLDKEIYRSYKTSIIAYSIAGKRMYSFLKRLKQKKLNYFE